MSNSDRAKFRAQMRGMKEWCLSWAFILLTSCNSINSNTEATEPSPFSALRSFSLRRASINRSGGFLSFPLLVWPVEGSVLSRFEERKDDIMNKGIDIQAPVGSPVRAAQDGEVSFVSDQMKGFGRVIIINHQDGFQTVYAHNSENLVTVGRLVKKTQIIAKVGSTDQSSIPYLHFEVRRNHRPVDPLRYLTESV